MSKKAEIVVTIKKSELSRNITAAVRALRFAQSCVEAGKTWEAQIALGCAGNTVKEINNGITEGVYNG